MASTTPNLGLIKPEMTDNMTPTIFADNFDKLDAAVSSKVSRTELAPYAATKDLDIVKNIALNNTNSINQLNASINGISSYIDEINAEVI